MLRRLFFNGLESGSSSAAGLVFGRLASTSELDGRAKVKVLDRRTRVTASANALRRGAYAVLYLGCVGIVGGCANPAQPSAAQPSATAAAPESESSSSEPANSDQASSEGGQEPEAAESTTAPASAEPGAAAPEQSVAELCSAFCDSVQSKCSKKRSATCRANCPEYVDRAKRCEAAVRSALQCLGMPGNVECAPFAPEQCKEVVKAANDCEATGETHVVAETNAPQLPVGWERIEQADAGFSALLPKGAVKARDKDADVWRSQEDGVEYQVHVSAAPERKDERHLLKSAWAFVGPECTAQLKLHGRIEKQGRVSVRFDSTCKDGASWHGIFHIASNKLYRVAFKAPAGKSGKLDLFVYGFELAKL